ncbi:uncharacterized protein LOC128387346 [Panonychus citri]|uniref:uncharacterized protein LOC128387346 n=1 Tax=Panonychus citri TaxID=50023 RepID=UPI002307CAA5|nr:uncharacterized protein LOC128387346 [Panonychus citri]
MSRFVEQIFGWNILPEELKSIKLQQLVDLSRTLDRWISEIVLSEYEKSNQKTNKSSGFRAKKPQPQPKQSSSASHNTNYNTNYEEEEEEEGDRNNDQLDWNSEETGIVQGDPWDYPDWNISATSDNNLSQSPEILSDPDDLRWD